MHHEQIDFWLHDHTFNAEKKMTEKRTSVVVVVTLVTMIAEIFFGWLTNSMALLADGWHMGTHAFALSISLLAYILARKYALNQRFTFGTWKIEILGAYTSAVVLGIVGIAMMYTSVERMLHPLAIQYNEALFVAVFGLLVNLACAAILGSHDHEHEHPQGHEHEGTDHHDHAGRDLNLKSAYLHVAADALTSVFAILALLGAKFASLSQLDPCMGLVGACLIIRWSALLLKDTSGILLDYVADPPLAREIRRHIESDGDSKVSDLHVWRITQGQYACIVAVVTGRSYTIDEYKTRLADIGALAHITVELNICEQAHEQSLLH
jgi:cation diffusion facilitator family transporter